MKASRQIYWQGKFISAHIRNQFDSVNLKRFVSINREYKTITKGKKK